jgi:hypothetical protein
VVKTELKSAQRSNGQSFCGKQAFQHVVLAAGDAVHVPRDAEHSAEVIGAEPVVSLDAVKVS